MKKTSKLISFILSIVMILQAVNLSFVWGDVTGSVVSDEVISGSSVIDDNYGISTFSASNEQSDDNTLQDIVLVLDDSGSMTSGEMKTLKEASIKFCETILEANPNNRVGIVAFAKSVRYDFSSDIEELKKNINTLYDSGTTPLDEGIIIADDIFVQSWRDNTIKSMVIMSDGEPDNESETKDAYINVANKYNIYSVYFGNNSSARSFMESIQNSGFFNAEDVDSLIEQFGKIAEVILNPLEIYTTESLISEHGVGDYIYQIQVYFVNRNVLPIYNVNVSLVPDERMSLFQGDTITKNIGKIEASGYSEYVMWQISIPFSEIKGITTVPYRIQVTADNYVLNFYDDSITVTPFNTSDNILDDENTWSFNNYTIDSSNGILSKDFKNALLFGLPNSSKAQLTENMNRKQNGQCFGMATTVILEQLGIFDSMNVTNVEIGNVINKVNAKPFKDIKLDNDIKNFINYYHLTQCLPAYIQEKINFQGETTKAQLEFLEDAANDCALFGGAPILIDFNIDNNNGIIDDEDGGHAIVGYNIEYGKWKKDDNEYKARVITYDPNWQFIIGDADSYIYFNPGTDEWCIPNYNALSFKAITNDVNILDGFNLENKTTNLTRNIATIRMNKKISLLLNGKSIIDNGNVVSRGYYFDAYSDFDSNSNETYVNLILDKDIDYLLESLEEEHIDISLMYTNFFEKAISKNAKGSLFSSDGSVSLIDNVGEYSLGLTANDGYTSLPWYTVTVEGEKAENPSLEITDEGYLFEGEELKNIKVTANNDDETKELTFDSDNTSVLITNDNDSLIVKEDSDNDGIYDKVIADSDSTVTEETETTTIAKSYHGGGAGASSLKVINYDEATTVEELTEITTESEAKEESVDFSQVKVTIGSNIITIDDSEYEMDAAAYIQSESNSTMVPLRFVALAISGGDVEKADDSSAVSWDAVTKTATITANGNRIEFTAGSNTMIVNGASSIMDNGVAAEIKDGRMYIPFRALGEAMGVDVEWDADTKTAIYSIK